MLPWYSTPTVMHGIFWMVITLANFTAVFSHHGDVWYILNQNAPRPSEHPPVRGGELSKRLGGIKGCKYKTSSWHLNGFPYGRDIGYNVGVFKEKSERA